MRTQTDNISLFEERPLCGRVTSDGLGQMLKAMEELDTPENIPEGLDPSIWERFCLARRAKVESEHQVMRAHLKVWTSKREKSVGIQ